MAAICFGLVRTHVYSSGAEKWEVTFDSASMERGLSEFIPAESAEAGIEELSRRYPSPQQYGDALSRVFSVKSSRDRGRLAVVLPHPMLRSLASPASRETAYVEKLRNILLDPVCGGLMYLPAKQIIQSILQGWYSGDLSPNISSGQPYNDTTPDSFSKYMRKIPEFQNAGFVFGRAYLEHSDYSVDTLRLDPDGVKRRMKAAATRERTKTIKKAAETAKNETRQRVTNAWYTLDGLVAPILSTCPKLRGYAVDVDYTVPWRDHPVVRLRRYISLVDAIGPKGRWRRVPELITCFLAMLDVKNLIGTESDFRKNTGTVPVVRRAMQWFWREAQAAKRRQKYRRKGKTSSTTTTPQP